MKVFQMVGSFSKLTVILLAESKSRQEKMTKKSGTGSDVKKTQPAMAPKRRSLVYIRYEELTHHSRPSPLQTSVR